jgi:hypothetical protein
MHSTNPLQFMLTGSHEYRFRIGDYRVIFEIMHGTLWVNAIKRRTTGIDSSLPSPFLFRASACGAGLS